MKLKIILYGGILVIITCSACKKYLDAKSNKSLVIATKISDYQALLDNNTIMNRVSPSNGEGSADNYYLNYSDWDALYNDAYKNIYVWGDEITYDLFPNDWGQAYDQVYFCNNVLEGLDVIQKDSSNANEWDNAEGSAFFFRANAFLKLVLTWANAYDSATAGKEPGIPLRLNTDFNEVSVRATIQDCYNQVLNDAEQAVNLLPVNALFATRPSKAAAYGLIARTCLAMRNYTRAGLYADSCLQLNHTLIDYNTLNTAASYPIAIFNAEMIFYAGAFGAELSNSIANIDTVLLASYSDSDLRKTIFFKDRGNGTFGFKGSYNGNNSLFTGIAVDEMYLIRAECYARENNAASALNDLNTLLQNRWKKGTYIPYETNDAQQALNRVLEERRKELPFRDLRWMDLKRLNKEPGRQVTITRLLNGAVYTLPPNDPRYALPIPATVIELTGMQQNPR